MKKFLLIALIGLALILSGCSEFGVKDCGTDLGCFKESLKNGEKAKVKFTETVELTHLLCLCGHRTIENTEARIIECEESTCEVNFTNIEYWDDMDYENDGTEIRNQWKYAKCILYRNSGAFELAALDCEKTT